MFRLSISNFDDDADQMDPIKMTKSAPSLNMLISKLFLFLVGIMLLHAVLLQLVPTLELQVHPYIAYFKEQLRTEPDIVYFGDSVIGSLSIHDNDQRSIDRMLDAQLSQNISGMHGPGLGMDMFLAFTDYILQREHRPQTIIIPINMRSFSFDWAGPGWQFQKEKAYLAHHDTNPFFRIFFKPFAVFKTFSIEPTEVHDYENSVIWYDGQPIVKVKEMKWHFLGTTDDNRRKVLIYYYMYKLTPDHNFVQNMQELARKLRAHNIDTLFYITPIDYQAGEASLGSTFTERLSKNTRILNELLANEGVELLDLSQSLETEYFDWATHPNEHLNEQGRHFVADQIAAALRKQNE